MGNRIQRRFDYLRQQTEQGVNQEQQKAQEGLERQAASKGRLGSGVYQKQQMEQQKQGANIKQQALEGVEVQRDAALGAQEENQANRDFAKSEREAGQGFAAEQAGINRAYGTAEREAGQGFASSERLAAQGFNMQLFEKDMAFKDKLSTLQDRQFTAQMNATIQQLHLDQKVSSFNMKMAKRQSDKNDLMGFKPNSTGTGSSF